MAQYTIDRSMWNWQNIFGCILPNWVNISPRPNFVVISLYGGFFIKIDIMKLKDDYYFITMYTFPLSKYIAKYIYTKSFYWDLFELACSNFVNISLYDDFFLNIDIMKCILFCWVKIKRHIIYIHKLLVLQYIWISHVNIRCGHQSHGRSMMKAD